jgi:hypothetical protein
MLEDKWISKEGGFSTKVSNTEIKMSVSTLKFLFHEYLGNGFSYPKLNISLNGITQNYIEKLFKFL